MSKCSYLFLSTVTVVLVATAAWVGAQTGKDGDKPQPPAGGGMQGAIVKEHELLKKLQGEWTVAFKGWFAGPTSPPMESPGTSKLQLECNGLWLVEEFSTTLMGAPFLGHGVIGYDTQKQKYVTYWFDSQTANASIAEGTYDEAAKKLSMSGTMISPEGPIETQQITQFNDDGSHTFSILYDTPQGRSKMLEITYTPSKDKSSKDKGKNKDKSKDKK